jgi:hypothetical protein
MDPGKSIMNIIRVIQTGLIRPLDMGFTSQQRNTIVYEVASESLNSNGEGSVTVDFSNVLPAGNYPESDSAVTATPQADDRCWVAKSCNEK